MKNNLQKSQRKNAGFTLLELVVVVAVMGLISSMAMDIYTDNSNQKRFEATKERLAEIKFAIIGDPMMRVGSQAVIEGSYYYDMGRLPETLSELIYQCRDASYIGINSADQTSCETIAGNVWETTWNGPYLINLQSSGGDLVFHDAWGNSSSSSDGKFGWIFNTNSTNKTILLQSLGLDHSSTGTNTYELNYPTSGNLINKVDLDRIDHLNSLTTTSGYCINTAISATYTIDFTYNNLASCNAETDRNWAAFP